MVSVHVLRRVRAGVNVHVHVKALEGALDGSRREEGRLGLNLTCGLLTRFSTIECSPFTRSEGVTNSGAQHHFPFPSN